ncbi:ferredoxin [Dactylosporangium darangshiense]|jgi:ferredoxin|uniref:Ferredoxin n=1 Tax=Dactylosporangium darangshiense TaxID=579108 RepID=A0ABP8DEY5_9ACTN|nr:ferredoxin [Dactylosporangium sp.]
MKVAVDADRCMGHGMCQALAPQVYRINDDTGFNEMGDVEIPDGLADAARRGQEACPERAIALDGMA